MEGNPYAAFWQMARSDNDSRVQPSFLFGTVKSTNPLEVTVCDTVQEASDLLYASCLGTLYTGEKILLIPIEGGQRLIMLCKVVGL